MPLILAIKIVIEMKTGPQQRLGPQLKKPIFAVIIYLLSF
jgi:hypothetical protein